MCREHGRRQAGRHGSRVDESSHLIHWHEAERAKRKWYGILKPHSWSQVTHPLQRDHMSQSFPSSSTDWGPSIQTHKPMGAILIPTITYKKLPPKGVLKNIGYNSISCQSSPTFVSHYSEPENNFTLESKCRREVL